MRFRSKIINLFFSCALFSSCASDNYVLENLPIEENPITEAPAPFREIKYLALGDSYTIGQSVCETCRFPEQLKLRIASEFNASVDLKIIAQTGWTTTNLKSAINSQNPASNYELVTLLIGVNNQYQNRPFSLYQQEFPELLLKAISLANGHPENVIVVSIPDYAYTPYGQNSTDPNVISTEIDNYNSFAETTSAQNGVIFVNITDITRMGLENPNLVASDGLHPSELAYLKFVEKILPKALISLEN
jgi:acyl-CoA thioesterase-1